MSEAIVDAATTEQNGPAVGKRKTALISAPSSVDTSAIRSALNKQGLSSFSIDQLDLPGRSLGEIISQGMERADLVVGVVDVTAASGSVIFEMGIAQGLGKPSIVFVIGDAPPTPWVSSGVPYFRFDPSKPVGLDYVIAQVMKSPHHGTKGTPAPVKRTRPLGPLADQLLTELQEAGEGFGPEDFERLIGRALRASGFNSVSPGPQLEKYIDFAVWSDDWQPWIGNPFFIELRMIVRDVGDLTTAAEALTRAMAPVASAWGLLIYHRASVDVAAKVNLPNVLTISAEKLLVDLREMSFGELVRRMRNERVHGNP